MWTLPTEGKPKPQPLLTPVGNPDAKHSRRPEPDPERAEHANANGGAGGQYSSPWPLHGPPTPHDWV